MAVPYFVAVAVPHKETVPVPVPVVSFRQQMQMQMQMRRSSSHVRRFTRCRTCASASSISHPHSHSERKKGPRRRSLVLTSALLSLLLPPHLQLQLAPAVELSEESAIRNSLRKYLSKTKAAGMLRLAFHDAATFDVHDYSGGMNGSVIYELDRPENAGLAKSIKILGKAKGEIDKIQQVSWADLIALAGAEAVSLCGGPIIPVQLGRVDSMKGDAEGKLPEETFDAAGLKLSFQNKGFSTQEMVVLSGAHTIGGKGFGKPTVFDNSYFQILLDKPWTTSSGMASMIGLPSDRALAVDDECLRWIKIYADNQANFFDDFSSAYVKLVNSGASWKIPWS